MDNMPKPRDKDYLNYLSGLIQTESTDTSPKPSLGQRPQPTLRTKSQRPNVLIVCGALLIVVLLLMVRAILFPGTGADNSPEFKQRQQNANLWALSGAQSIILARLKNAEIVEFPLETVDSTHLGGDRWRVWGIVDSQDGQSVKLQNQWVVEIEYFQDKKTGEITKVFLDDVLIYSR